MSKWEAICRRQPKNEVHRRYDTERIGMVELIIDDVEMWIRPTPDELTEAFAGLFRAQEKLDASRTGMAELIYGTKTQCSTP